MWATAKRRIPIHIYLAPLDKVAVKKTVARIFGGESQDTPQGERQFYSRNRAPPLIARAIGERMTAPEKCQIERIAPWRRRIEARLQLDWRGMGSKSELYRTAAGGGGAGSREPAIRGASAPALG